MTFFEPVRLSEWKKILIHFAATFLSLLVPSYLVMLVSVLAFGESMRIAILVAHLLILLIGTAILGTFYLLLTLLKPFYHLRYNWWSVLTVNVLTVAVSLVAGLLFYVSFFDSIAALLILYAILFAIVSGLFKLMH